MAITMALPNNLDDLLNDLRLRAEDNVTRPDYRLKPNNEPVLIETVLKLADEVKELRNRVQHLEKARG